MKDDEDFIYVEQTINGNVNAFSFIVNKYQNMVFTIVGKVVCDRENSQDVAQNVFLKAYKSLSSYKGNSKFSTWLYAIAYHEAVNYIKQERNYFVSISESSDIAEECDDDVNITYSDEMLKHLKEEIAILKPDEALLLSLFYNMGKSVEEIAEITGNSISNVKIKLFRTRKKLLLKLSKYE
ncbi:MAG: sigma-70 family RNA polymerase sigma factor [Bacteroidales bacterium]|jgi:RNA polymerase sigma-70 factor, ECF subfamily|nr:sigma-70 family RNA polymerase sigma factor [Bacteroidales bacterium]MDD3151576.1 sigma-70 family RNA polymerase sigma factor [Bacteroidales bacterium]MDD3914175.1 sigma-70 family RNA polymerase sigma factor [Bacteroidales bacterium]MDD4633710.1 sigma-70 family RNA polymerase sigma factor [Bacteroidales bacterium]